MKKQGILFTIISATLFGITPLLTKTILESGLDVFSILFYRNLIVLPFLYLMARVKTISFKIDMHQIKDVILVGVFGTFLTGVLLNSSYQYIAVGTATTLHFLYPLFVALLARILYRDTLSKGKLISLILALFGVCCFIDLKGSGSFIGIVLATASGLSYAYYMIQLEKKHLSKIHPFILSFCLSMVVCQCIVVMNVFTPVIENSISLPIWFCLFLLAFLCSIIAVSLLQLGTRYLGATSASLLCLFEPMISILMGWILLDETLSPMKIIGCGIILWAVIIFVLDQKA